MSYLVLARKYRPQNFQEIVGQKPVVKTLQNALLKDRVAHALLFSGIRGTGKTTLARIMAKAINCENIQEAEPCNKCSSCISIVEGSSIDLQEVDGASNRGIQEIRELKDKIRFQPSSSKFKIIIIDEVHMLTTEAFNALLKTLEEPPSHVFFMFATTELHKVPVTILSRCQRYELKRLTRVELSRHFATISQKEGVAISEDALTLVVQEANGSVRDGLSILDQVFSYGGDEITSDDVVDILGVVNKQTIAKLIDYLLDKEADKVFSLFEELCLQGIDLKRLSREILEWLRNIALCKVSGNPDNLDLAESDRNLVMASAQRFTLETLTGAFNISLNGFDSALRSGYPKLAIELLLLKLVHVNDITPVNVLINQFSDLLAGNEIANFENTKMVVSSSEQDKKSKQKKNSNKPVPEAYGVKNNKDHNDQLPKKEEPEEVLSQIQPPPIPQEIKPDTMAADQEGTSEPESSTPLEQLPVHGKKTVRKNWDEFLLYVKDRQPWVSAALQGAASIKQQGKELKIHFDDSADCSILKDKKYINPLTEYALDFFQETLTIQFIVPGSDSCTINPENIKRPQQERKMLANDPLVLMAQEIFNGQVGDIRIGPRFRHKLESKDELQDTDNATEVDIQ